MSGVQATAPSSLRLTWYAGRPTVWGEFWTMLHLPYTVMVLSFIAAGAALAPHPTIPILLGTWVAYFLGLGIGAHLLDQISGMGSKYTTHWSDRRLWVGGTVALTGAVLIGIVGTVLFLPVWFLGLVAIQSVFAVGYPLAPLFRGFLHNDLAFAVSWGALPVLTSWFAQGAGFGPEVVLLSTGAALVAFAEIRLSRRARAIRRASQDTRPASAPEPFRALERWLVVLAVATYVFGFGLFLLRLGGGTG